MYIGLGCWHSRCIRSTAATPISNFLAQASQMGNILTEEKDIAMRRFCLWGLVCVAAIVPQCVCAEPWGPKMFNTLKHDFGTVARGSDSVYKFEIKNIWKEDVQIESVRSSCGCTSPSIENPNLKTHEVGYIVAKFNTRTFTGDHSATLTVKISKPFPTQVQLHVKGNIRGDVVFEPGSVEFGKIDQGAAKESTVKVAYSGRSDWRIDDVVADSESSDHFEVFRSEPVVQGGRVTYDLTVRLKPTAPAGYLNEQLVLVTNDRNNLRIPLDVKGQIIPELSVSPEYLVLGDVPAGDSVSKKLVVRGKKPFKITDMKCDDNQFSFSKDNDEAKPLHIIEVAFVASGKPGPLKAPIRIATDLGETFVATCNAYATVTAPPEPPKAEETVEQTAPKVTEGARVAEQSPKP